jgi:glutathione S-transferase
VFFTEYGVNSAHYQPTIVPIVGRTIMPVLEAPDGTIVKDGAHIIDYIAQRELPVLPAHGDTALDNTVSHLFELFGGEGLLRPAMHYCWNFEKQIDFIKNDLVSRMVVLGISQC